MVVIRDPCHEKYMTFKKEAFCSNLISLEAKGFLVSLISLEGNGFTYDWARVFFGIQEEKYRLIMKELTLSGYILQDMTIAI